MDDLMIKRPEAPSSSGGQGRWFCSAAYWLFPLEVPIRFPKQNTKQTAPICPTPPCEEAVKGKPRPATRAEAELRAEEIRNLAKELNETEARLYNAQPVWRMRDISIKGPSQVPEVVSEFLRMVDETATEFNWSLNHVRDELEWRAHGWKHVTYDAILSCWTDYCSSSNPAMARIEALGKIEEVQRLFSAAAGQDPEALGIIWSQFPSVEDQNEIIEYIYLPDQRPRGIRHPSELAADLVDTIFSMPGSKEADLARNSLLKLISVSVARGSRTRRGRPKTRIPIHTLEHLCKMSLCLMKQVRELNNFLRFHKSTDKDRHNCLLKAYPWMPRITNDMTSLLSCEPSKSGLRIVSCLTGVSTSFLEKMRRRPQT